MGGAHTVNDPNCRNHSEEEQKVYSTGAKRTKVKERFDLMCPVGLRRIAERYALGAEKYSDYNWCKGMPAGETLNHLIRHVKEYMVNGNKFDDNLAAIAWNAIALMHFEEDCQHHKAPWIEQDKNE